MNIMKIGWKLTRLGLLTAGIFAAVHESPLLQAAACPQCLTPSDCSNVPGQNGWEQCTVNSNGCTISGSICYSS